MVTPTGIWETEAFPKSAAGPLLRDLTPGSEGIFGIITDAWVHIHPVPEQKAYRSYFFSDFESGLQAARTLLQHEVKTAMVRLSDANETFFYSVLHGGAEVAENGPMGFCLMLVGFEGEAAEVAHERARAEAILSQCGGADMGGGMGEPWPTRWGATWRSQAAHGGGHHGSRRGLGRLPQLREVAAVLGRIPPPRLPPPERRAWPWPTSATVTAAGRAVFYHRVLPPGEDV